MPDSQVARDNIIDAFSRYWFEYDKFDNTIKIEPLRYLTGQYSRSSYVSLRGEISNKKAKNFRLVFKYYGSQWLFAKDLQVNVDGKNYNLNGLRFSRDHTDKVWEVASIPLKGKGLQIAKAISQGEDVEVRFKGKQYYHDVRVNNGMKKDISAMLKSIEYF